MSLVFAAITPHPPILIPSIGKESLDKIKKTKEAMERLEKELYASQPEIIIVISPHGRFNPEAFTLNVCDQFEADFQNFGDFATKMSFAGETKTLLIHKEKIGRKTPLAIVSEPNLDHGISVPLFYLAQKLKNVRIAPIYFSLFDSQTHLEFGKSLKEVILSASERIAVIASGDLSHCLTKNAPLPFNQHGKEFDELIIGSLETGKTQNIVNIDPKLAEEAGECGLRSILITLGILYGMNFQAEILSYEAPFGVGYLTTNFKLA